MDKPKVLVFAGPNGSGKSTISQFMDLVGLYINADDIRAGERISDLEAAQEAEQLREYCLANKHDFTFETVLSTDRNLKLLQRAKAAGYYIKSVFVLTCNAKINIARVESRVLNSGHNVPTEKIMSRYERSLGNIPHLVELSDEITIFDNSRDKAEIIYHRDGKDTFMWESPDLSFQDVRLLLMEQTYKQ